MESNKTEEERTQQAYMELQMLDGQIRQLQQQIQILRQQGEEVGAVKNNLTETSKAKKGNTILVPLANGIFAKAKIEDVENLLVNVGAGTVVTKNLEDTKSMLDDQLREGRRVEAKLIREQEQLVHQFNFKQAEVQKMIAKQKNV
ncbi:prefoldin subunit alpha [Candidatus Woesearchaeota archaeon]|nr:prefoldin subunit alpha [Candidatus Woesearchaeota archaeon]